MTKLDKERLETLAAEGRDFLAKSLQLGKVDFRIFGRLAELKQDARVEGIEFDNEDLCEDQFNYNVEFNRTLGLEEFRDIVETYFGKNIQRGFGLDADRWVDVYKDYAIMGIERKRNSYRVRFEPIEGFEE